MNTLPNEILLRVFTTLVHPDHRQSRGHMEIEARALLSVTRVCRLWHALSMSAAELWGCIVQPDFEESLFDLILERAKSSPISVVFTSVSGVLNPYEHRPSIRRNFSRIFTLVPRWSIIYLHFGGSPSDVLDLDEFYAALHLPAPLLHSFTTCHTRDTQDPAHRMPLRLLMNEDGHDSHPIQVLQLCGPQAINTSLRMDRTLTNITRLALHSSDHCGGRAILENPVLRERFSPRSLSSFIGLLERLEELLLGGCIAWSEPSYPAYHTFDLPASSHRRHMTRLKRFSLFDDVFSCFRLLQFLELPSNCAVRIHGAVLNNEFAWDPEDNLLRDTFRAMTDPIPSVSFDTLSIVVGHLFTIRIEAAGDVIFDLKLDLGMLESYRSALSGDTFADLSALYSDFLPPLVEGWALETITVLRFGVHFGSYELESFGGVGLQAVGEALFTRCKSVTTLHVFGVSFPLYQALAGCWYEAGTWKTVDALPSLSTIVIVGSSFVDLNRRRKAGLNFQVLDRFLTARFAKHHDVHPVSNVIFAGLPPHRATRGSIGHEQLYNTFLPVYISTGGSISAQSYQSYG